MLLQREPAIFGAIIAAFAGAEANSSESAVAAAPVPVTRTFARSVAGKVAVGFTGFVANSSEPTAAPVTVTAALLYLAARTAAVGFTDAGIVLLINVTFDKQRS